MYKLLIVDDEEIEREGMAQFIPWEKYQIQLVGTAWNGVDGFYQIREKQPDIVLTDIKMPVMDGIELIKKTREVYPSVEFIVLSGYGEYEYTSQAMEQGVRHYVLKPCDETRIAEVLVKVKEEIENKRRHRRQVETYQETVEKLLPRAREQIFRNLLLEREELGEDSRVFLREMEKQEGKLCVLGFSADKGFDELEQFILSNVLRELLGEKRVLQSTCIGQEVLFLLNSRNIRELKAAAGRIHRELAPFAKRNLMAAVSEEGTAGELGKLYVQIQELFKLGYAFSEGRLLYREIFREKEGDVTAVFDGYRLQKARDFEIILFESYLICLKMKAAEFTQEQIREVAAWGGKMLGLPDWKKEEIPGDLQKLTRKLTLAASEKNLQGQPDEDENRMRQILFVIYENLSNQKLTIQYISREILYMNEEYFGRLFSRYMKEKFSAFLLNRRIGLAKRLLAFRPDLKLSVLAEMVGYAPDGQYFSKAFRKLTGMSPTEYREKRKARETSGEV